jgi:hypothetical protein
VNFGRALCIPIGISLVERAMRLALGIVVVAATPVADAQPARTVRGVVVRANTPTPIAGASVLSERGEIAITDVDGYFAITLGAADRELTIAAPGYETRTVRIGDGALTIGLAPASGAEVIEITGKAPEETKPVSYQLTVDEIVAIPGTGNDILRAATVLPGVARIPFSFGGLVLRGMSPRDTAIWLDGVEVPIAFHFGGISSFYPSGMLADLTVTAGGYDAGFGRAAGGLVTLATRAPRNDRWRLGGSIGLFDSSIQAEGPWRGGGVIIGVRRSYLDRIVDPFVPEDTPLPSYWDFQLRTTWGDPRGRGQLSPMIFGSIDRVANNEVSLTQMFVRIAAPYTRQRDAITLHVVPWIGTNRLTFAERDDFSEQSFSRPFYPGGVRSELVRDATWGHLRGGVEIASGYLDPTKVNVNDAELGGDTTLAWTDLAMFGELRWRLDGERLSIKPGVRVEAYGLSGEVVIDPRLNLHQQLTDGLTLRQAIGRYHQPPTPGDVDPQGGNPNLDSSYTDQVSLGVDAILPEEILTSVTAYFNYGRKLGVRVQNPRPGSDTIEPNLGGLGPTFELLLEKQLGFATYRENIGRARSYGLEVMLKRNVGRLFTLLSYTLAKSERTDDPRVLVGWRPFELDQRHNLQVAASIQLTNWRLGARVQAVTGNPYTTERYDGFDIVRGEPFGARLPMFFSLDLRADRRWRRCWGDLVFYIDVQNVTNRRNVEGRQYDYSEDREADIRGLPIIPFLGLEFRPTI